MEITNSTSYYNNRPGGRGPFAISAPSSSPSDQGTVGNWDQVGAAQTAAVAKAALLAHTLPSNQPNQSQYQNYLQGLANVFGPQAKVDPMVLGTQQDVADYVHSPIKNLQADSSGLLNGLHSFQKPAMDVESLLKNPTWNAFYAGDSEHANRVYKAATGSTFDEALKEQQDQKDYIKKTVQQRVASNRLRQGVTGDWEEDISMPADPTNPLSKSGPQWVPASSQTMAMVKAAGGGKGIYGADFSDFGNIPIAQASDRLTRAGVPVSEQPAWYAAHPQFVTKNPATSQVSSPVLNSIKTDSNYTPGILGSVFGPSFSDTQKYNAQTQNDGEPDESGPMSLNQTKAAIMGHMLLHNLKSKVFGGSLQNTDFSITNQ